MKSFRVVRRAENARLLARASGTLSAMSDALSQKIAERREERDKLLRHLERVEVELAALELAANLRPVNDLSAAVRRTNSVGAEPRGKGRQFGAISKNWRTVLAMMAELYPDGASDDNIAELARAQGLQNLRPRDARHRMRSFQTHTFVEESPKGWRVTKVATDRFGFDSHPHNETADDSQSSAVLKFERSS